MRLSGGCLRFSGEWSLAGRFRLPELQPGRRQRASACDFFLRRAAHKVHIGAGFPAGDRQLADLKLRPSKEPLTNEVPSPYGGRMQPCSLASR
jgi:hypothetical protein